MKAKTGSEALSQLQSELTRLSNIIMEISQMMNTDALNLKEDWKDEQYTSFMEGFKVQIKNCEMLANRYTEWCTGTLQKTINSVQEVEQTKVGGMGTGGSISGGNAADNTGAKSTNFPNGGREKDFNLGNENSGKKITTKAVPIFNGCGSDTAPGSKFAASYVVIQESQIETYRKITTNPMSVLNSGKIFMDEVEKRNNYCKEHDLCYYNGKGETFCDEQLAQKPDSSLGDWVILGKKVGIGKDSYANAQKDREISQQLQAKWEEEHNQPLDTKNFRVIPINED